MAKPARRTFETPFKSWLAEKFCFKFFSLLVASKINFWRLWGIFTGEGKRLFEYFKEMLEKFDSIMDSTFTYRVRADQKGNVTKINIIFEVTKNVSQVLNLEYQKNLGSKFQPILTLFDWVSELWCGMAWFSIAKKNFHFQKPCYPPFYHAKSWHTTRSN